ncbi:MAG: amidase family protein [Pseudomonadota bacterium]
MTSDTSPPNASSPSWQCSASEIARQIRTRATSAEEVTRQALDRLGAVNPAINAVVESRPEEALTTARAIDAALDRGLDLGPLAGVPVTTKVNVDQAGYATTNGLRRQCDLMAESDNPVVANLRKAGAVFIGRTNTPAFSLRWFTRNSLHGATRNPHDPSLTPGGSSGGAAAAVAAGIGAIGHGTDIGGSIRYPAYACGIHGLRPTLGRVPAANLSAPDRHIGGQLMAVSGPLARHVGDLRLALSAMAAPSTADPWWVPAAPRPEAARTCALDLTPEGLATDPAVKDALRRAADALSNAGWRVTETACPPIREPARLQLLLWTAEYRGAAAEAVAAEGDPDAVFVFEQLQTLAETPDLDSVLAALQRRVALVREWQRFFAEYSVLLCPNSAELPFANHDDVTSPERFREIAEAQLLQLGTPFLGLPGLSVATGKAGRHPVGVQLVGGRYDEATLLAAGEAIETASPPVRVVDPVGA